MSLELRAYKNHELFKNDVLSFLKKKELINGLIIGLTEKLGSNIISDYMAVIRKDEKLKLVILQTHPKQAILAYSDDIKTEELKEMATLIVKDYPEIPGMIGERNFTNQLATDITELTHVQAVVAMDQRIYRLDAVHQPADMTGATFKQVSIEELHQVAEWIYDFASGTSDVVSLEDAHKKAKKHIEAGYLYGWYVNEQLVSICNSSRKTKSSRTVSLVYTPKDERKKGYASNCVAAFSQRLLDEGNDYCVLYTDLANNTSNKIYMAIGYKPICDSMVIHFKKSV